MPGTTAELPIKTVAGLRCAIENPRGSVRKGIDADGKPWETVMPYDYGYFVLAEGIDGDKLDVCIGAHHKSNKVFVVHQKDPSSGAIEELKVMLGYPTRAAAVAAFDAGYNKPGFRGDVEELDLDAFKVKYMGAREDRPAELVKSMSFEDETALIRESAKTPEAQARHKFRPAKWTHKNGHPRCVLCGEEESDSGYCSGVSLCKALLNRARLVLMPSKVRPAVRRWQTRETAQPVNWVRPVQSLDGLPPVLYHGSRDLDTLLKRGIHARRATDFTTGDAYQWEDERDATGKTKEDLWRDLNDAEIHFVVVAMQSGMSRGAATSAYVDYQRRGQEPALADKAVAQAFERVRSAYSAYRDTKLTGNTIGWKTRVWAWWNSLDDHGRDSFNHQVGRQVKSPEDLRQTIALYWTTTDPDMAQRFGEGPNVAVIDPRKVSLFGWFPCADAAGESEIVLVMPRNPPQSAPDAVRAVDAEAVLGVAEDGPIYGDNTLARGLVAVTDDPAEAIHAIEGLYKYAVDLPGAPRRGVVYRIVGPEEAAAFKAKTGMDVAGYQHVVDSYGIRHSVRKHGTPESEEPRGQVPITVDDFRRIDEITRPENIVRVSQKRGMPPMVEYELDTGDYVIVGEEVRSKRRHLALQTVYKRKKGEDGANRANMTPANGVPPHNARSDGRDSSSPERTVPQNRPLVKSLVVRQSTLDALVKGQLSLFPGMVLAPAPTKPTVNRWQQTVAKPTAPKPAPSGQNPTPAVPSPEVLRTFAVGRAKRGLMEPNDPIKLAGSGELTRDKALDVMAELGLSTEDAVGALDIHLPSEDAKGHHIYDARTIIEEAVRRLRYRKTFTLTPDDLPPGELASVRLSRNGRAMSFHSRYPGKTVRPYDIIFKDGAFPQYDVYAPDREEAAKEGIAQRRIWEFSQRRKDAFNAITIYAPIPPAPPPPKVERITVYRIGSAQGGLGQTNASDLNGMVDIVRDRILGGQSMTVGDTLSVYNVEVSGDMGDYQSYQGKGPWCSGQQKTVGRFVKPDGTSTWYSFPEKAPWKAERVASVPISAITRMAIARFKREELTNENIRALINEAILNKAEDVGGEEHKVTADMIAGELVDAGYSVIRDFQKRVLNAAYQRVHPDMGYGMWTLAGRNLSPSDTPEFTRKCLLRLIAGAQEEGKMTLREIDDLSDAAIADKDKKPSSSMSKSLSACREQVMELLRKGQLSLFPGMVLKPSAKNPTVNRWQQTQAAPPRAETVTVPSPSPQAAADPAVDVSAEVKARAPESFIPSRATYDAYREGYFTPEGKQLASSRLQPAKPYPYAVGAWRIDNHFGPYGREIEKLVELDPKTLTVTEADYTRKSDDPTREEDARRYAQWMKDGLTPPPVVVVERDDGTLAVSDGHRRVAGAKLAGKPITGWVSYKMDTGRKTPDGKPIYTAMTYEGVVHGHEKAGLMYDKHQSDVFTKSLFGDTHALPA